MTALMSRFWPFSDAEWTCERCRRPVRLSEAMGVYVDGKPIGAAHYPECPED